MNSSLDHPSATPDNADDDHPGAGAEARLQAMRVQLTRRINTYTHPSRLINQIGLADWRCSQSTRVLTRLIGRSPKVLKVIRAELRKEFEIDPDSLLFTEAATPDTPQKVDSLTDRALLLLTRPRVEANVNQFIALSIKGTPDRRFALTPLQVLQRVIAMRLLERLAPAADMYWDALADGSWLTRRELWVLLHHELFADRAFLARQLDELSSAGMALVQAVIDAPTAEARQRAGGDRACVRVAELKWPGTPTVAIPGALHFYSQGGPIDAPHVIHLPGLARTFHEYPSFVALQCGVLELSTSRFDELWQCLPLSRRSTLCRPEDLSPASSVVRGLELTEDALALGAQALLNEQWNNELACALTIYHKHVFSKELPRPQPLDAVPFLTYVQGGRKQLVGGARLGELREQLLEWDHKRRRLEVIFSSTSSGLALRTQQHQINRYEKGLLALLDSEDAGVETLAYQEVVSLASQRAVHAQALNALLQEAQQRLFDLDFWNERPDGKGTARRVSRFMQAQTEALRCEVQLQHRLKLLSTAHRDLVIEVVDQPSPTKRPDSQTQVMSIAIGSESGGFYPIHNVWVITTAAAVRVPVRQLPVVLYAFGIDGGVMAFAGLDALTQSLKASLNSCDDSMLWGGVERDKRIDLRAHAAGETLAVRYVPIVGKPALAALKKLLGTYYRLYNSSDALTRMFSEVTDAQMSRELLMGELEGQLAVPVNSALIQAQANMELFRKVASEAKKMPAWLKGATHAQRKHFKRLLGSYLGDALAFFIRLEQRLPDLNTYARRELTARLRQDGIPSTFDIDQPFIAMSGDIHGTYCGYTEACALRDPKKRVGSSFPCSAFSVLQLTLDNLDPEATWTQYKLNRACFLQVAGPRQITTGYLRNMVSSLDVGGQYEGLIDKVFYPPVSIQNRLSDGRIPELLNRALQADFKRHLFSAILQGLSANAQSIINTAMAARTPQDLLKNQHKLQLHLVYLMGHTLPHNRYIAGIVVVQDQRSGLCVVYWPQAPQSLVLTEYRSLRLVQDELNRLGALPDNVKVLAGQVAPGWASKALCPLLASSIATRVFECVSGAFLLKCCMKSFFLPSPSPTYLQPTVLPDEIEKQILEQIASDPQGWLVIHQTSSSNVQALLYRASVLERHSQTQAASYSNKTLKEYRLHRLREASIATTRMLLGTFIPLFGLFNDVYELVAAVRRYHRSGDALDKRVLADSMKWFALNLILMLVPGGKPRGGAIARSTQFLKRNPPYGRLSGIYRPASSTVTVSKVLERFKIKGAPDGAVPLQGVDEKGVYVKDGQPFWQDDSGHYPLYRRESDLSFRSINTDTPGQNELILNIHVGRERLLGADAPQPVAGPSSGVLNPWNAPVLSPADWRPPVVRSTTESGILQSSMLDTHWLSWRTYPQINQLSNSIVPDVFHTAPGAPDYPHHVLRVAPPNISLTDPLSGYYRLLPQGDQAPLDRIVFIHKNELLVSRAGVDIERWTSTALDEQPLAVSRTPAGAWQIHAPLFDRPLASYVGRAFPTMTLKSRDFLVARLIELADPSRRATASHLLNVRATLDRWLPPAPLRRGQTDDWLRMLRPTQPNPTSTYIGYEGAAPGLTRIDFRPPSTLDPQLQRGGRQLAVQRMTAQRTEVIKVLEEQGFIVQEFEVMRTPMRISEALVTHPNSNNLYYVSYKWLKAARLGLVRKLNRQWLDEIVRMHPTSSIPAALRRAMDEHRLIQIIAGIQWPTQGAIPPSVYFVRLNLP